MKTSLLALLLLVSAPVALRAQTTIKTKTKSADGTSEKTITTVPANVAPDARMQSRADALTENLRKALGDLTPAQVEKIRQVNLTSVRKMEAASGTYSLDLNNLNRMAQEIGSSRMAGIKEVLTPAQFARYQQKREQKMGVPTTAGRASAGSAPADSND